MQVCSLFEHFASIDSFILAKKDPPVVTVTQASPLPDPVICAEKDSAQFLLPSSLSATSDGSTASK